MINSEKQYQLEFLVEANTWQEAVKIFKTDLGIDNEKQNVTDFQTNNTFLVHVSMRDSAISKEFYKKVFKSRKIALVYDPKGADIRNKIMDIVAPVEHNLRIILLNINEVIDDYFRYFKNTYAKDFAKDKSLIKTKDLNPLTSYLTLGDIIQVLSADTSLSNKNLTAEDMMSILKDYSDINDVKHELSERAKPCTIWDQIDKHILKKGIKWEEIKGDLGKLEKIRNKAAHFRIVTESDLQNVRKSANAINKKIAIKRHPSKEEIKGLQESLKGFKVLKNLLKPSAQRIATTIYQPFEKLQFQNIQALQQAIQAAVLPQINIHLSILNESDGDEPAE
ncbi:hypothetical protein [Candidatus Nanoperiomorbus periodonticus]|uniref:hypothetical protein n=2 Tax=Candidatus Nanoperiomorbus periodonticus TaxID=2171989 RepID=UPI00101CA827|nr:hypothetical protein [Candidatus Nanoperiomorbus periodonticus]RYC76001.1 hypothetical protein G52EAM_00030 [Candidatus Nanoperiomorbus periodonticus]